MAQFDAAPERRASPAHEVDEMKQPRGLRGRASTFIAGS